MSNERATISRRDLLSLIGAVSGSAAMYHAMTSLGFASDSGYKGPIKLDGDPKGTSVLILGAGLAGMTAALELREAGYQVQILEFNSRAGGRNWTLRGGDSFTELGGFKQTCEFEQGLYLNPGPWRIPYHHRALLDYCRRLGVALDRDYKYNANLVSAEFRGYARDPGGGLGGAPLPSDPVALSDLLRSRIWRYLQSFARYNFQTTMFQPVGGMDMIGKAFAREVGSLIRYNSRVTQIRQNDSGVTVSYVDTANPQAVQQATADWCVCTIPLSILGQLPVDVGAAMRSAIDAVPYAGSVKVGLQFKRRFWEEDEAIYGGISYTDLPIRQIAYPNTGFNRAGRGVLLGAYLFEGANCYEFTAMPPAERVASAVEFGAMIHPQYKNEFENGIAVAWHRVPFTLGCAGNWTDKAREEHYDNLCQIDGRIVLAGEHASYLPAWQEGAILSALDAITRLHDRVVRT